MDGWTAAVAVLFPVALALRYTAYRVSAEKHTGVADNNVEAELRSLQRRYLAVYLAVKCADWLQGPYFYVRTWGHGYRQNLTPPQDLYATKIDSRTGELYTPAAISSLFLLGFLASVVAGTALGSVMDGFGRRNGCLVCAAVYFADCVLAHGTTHTALAVGRVCAGIASSLLHSVFESWLVAEAAALKAPPAWLGSLFSLQWFGDGVVAVMSGLLAQTAAHYGGPVRVFDVSGAMLLVTIALILALWPRASTTPETSSKPEAMSSVSEALGVMLSDRRIVSLAVVQALFEGAMYTFVLAWVPSLSALAGDAGLPKGIVFAGFMVCIMVGSSLFALATGKLALLSPVNVLRLALATAGVALGPAMYGRGVTGTAACFFVFEMCCGMYFPSAGCVRSAVVPAAHAGPILAMFRVPVSCFVVAVLMADLSPATSFTVCGVALGVATLLQCSFGPPGKAKSA